MGLGHKTIYLLAGAVAGFCVGGLIFSSNPTEISPKLEELLCLQFGHADLSQISDADAQWIISAHKEYIDLMDPLCALCWEVHAICGMKGLLDQSPAEYERQSLNQFEVLYQKGIQNDSIKPLADDLFNKLYPTH